MSQRQTDAQVKRLLLKTDVELFIAPCTIINIDVYKERRGCNYVIEQSATSVLRCMQTHKLTRYFEI